MGQQLDKCCESSAHNEPYIEKYQINKNVGKYDISSVSQKENNKRNIIKKYPINNFNEMLFSTISKSADSTASYIDSISIDIKKVVVIQSFYRSYHSRKMFILVKKDKLKELSNTLYNNLYEQYMKYTTKLAESLIGYKFNPKYIKQNKEEKKKIIFHNIFINKRNEIVPSIYKGDVDIQNKRNGYGIQLFNDGSKYEGNWIDNEFIGYGRYIDQNGDLYEGEFIKGMISSNGLLRSIDGSIYIGDFKKGLKHGQGSEENEDCEYKGQFENDLKNGKGKIKFKKTNEIYEGEFYKGEIHGIGIYYFASGDIYQGEFAKGKMNGKGLYKWKSGEEYYGDYINGIKEGNGTFTYLNGKVFEGQYKNGKPVIGRLLYKNKKYKVRFEKGKIVESVQLQ